MNVQNFRGFENLKEVQCSGTTLPNEVKFLSLTLYRTLLITRNTKETILATLETQDKVCKTFGDYSSCIYDDTDRRKSVVKTLVSDLKGGERTTIGCNVTAFFVTGKQKILDESWLMEVYRPSKCYIPY